VPFLDSLHIFGSMTLPSHLLLFLSAPKLRELLIVPLIRDDLDLLSAHLTTIHTPRFPALTSLTIAPSISTWSVDSEILRRASECFPNIELLVV
ncbi:hypothetical protein BDZ97DRAFT_1620512, partial [Flammula alnicola]